MKAHAVIAGNHSIDQWGNILFDTNAKRVGREIVFQNTDIDLIYLIDNIDINVDMMVRFKPKKQTFLKKTDQLLPEIISQIEEADYVIFEQSIKNIAKNKKDEFCSILGPNAYKPMEETRYCVCWGICAVLIHSLFKIGYEKVTLVTSVDSKQLKVSDVIKVQQFFKEDKRLEIIWAK